jgi:hypothetical protein
LTGDTTALAPTIVSWKAMATSDTLSTGVVRIGGSTLRGTPALCEVYFGSDGHIHMDDGSGNFDTVTDAVYFPGVWHQFDVVIDWVASPAQLALVVDGVHVHTQSSFSNTVTSLSRILLYNKHQFAASRFDDFALKHAMSFLVRASSLASADDLVAVGIVLTGQVDVPPLDCQPSGTVVRIDRSAHVVAASCLAGTAETDPTLRARSLDLPCTMPSPAISLAPDLAISNVGNPVDEAVLLFEVPSQADDYDSILFLRQDLALAASSASQVVEELDCTAPGNDTEVSYRWDPPTHSVNKNSVIWARTCGQGRDPSAVTRSSNIFVSVKPPEASRALAESGLNIDRAVLEVHPRTSLDNTTIYYSLGDGNQLDPWCNMVYGPQAFPVSGILPHEGGEVILEGRVTNAKLIACREGNEASDVSLVFSHVTSSWFVAGVAIEAATVFLATIFLTLLCISNLVCPRKKKSIFRRAWLTITGGNKVPLRDPVKPLTTKAKHDPPASIKKNAVGEVDQTPLASPMPEQQGAAGEIIPTYGADGDGEDEDSEDEGLEFDDDDENSMGKSG